MGKTLRTLIGERKQNRIARDLKMSQGYLSELCRGEKKLISKTKAKLLGWALR